MSHLLAPQENKRDTRTAQSEPVLKDTTFLVPPQEEKSIPKAQPSLGRRSWLVPPQEEMVNVAALRGEQARLDRAITRMEESFTKPRIEHDAVTVEDFARDKQQRDAVLSGAAGVTGEDFGFAENYHIRWRS